MKTLSTTKPIRSTLRDKNISLVDPVKYDILIGIRDSMYQAFPEADEKIMYGGVVFFFQGEMISGVFARDKYVTLEFSKGFLMDDPKGYLEGKGKYRRHLKIHTKEDISGKEVTSFIKQAVNPHNE